MSHFTVIAKTHVNVIAYIIQVCSTYMALIKEGPFHVIGELQVIVLVVTAVITVMSIWVTHSSQNWV